ncbi:MAG: PrsW family intramembrane metalloprotease [Blautia sp.]|nr:PrsW family intramembrane metalloprotease [Blautia sp.]
MEHFFTGIMAVAVIPPLFLIYRIWRLDRIEREPVSLLVKLFLLGVLAAIPAIILEGFAERFFAGIASSESAFVFLEMFFGVALVEEGVKYFFLKKGTWKSSAFDYVYDGVVYAVVVSLGFAAIENVFYVMDGGMETALARALTSIPGHCIFGICMGHYYGKAKAAEMEEDFAGKRTNLLKALLFPTIIHGFYDYIISIDWDYSPVVFILYVIILDVAAFVRVRRFSREDRPVGPGWTYLPGPGEEDGHGLQ